MFTFTNPDAPYITIIPYMMISYLFPVSDKASRHQRDNNTVFSVFYGNFNHMLVTIGNARIQLDR